MLTKVMIFLNLPDWTWAVGSDSSPMLSSSAHLLKWDWEEIIYVLWKDILGTKFQEIQEISKKLKHFYPWAASFLATTSICVQADCCWGLLFCAVTSWWHTWLVSWVINQATLNILLLCQNTDL